MKKTFNIVCHLFILFSILILLFQSGIALDEMASFETFFFENRIFLFFILVFSLLSLGIHIWDLLPLGTKESKPPV